MTNVPPPDDPNHPPAGDTIPAGPPDSEPLPVILAGGAQHALAQALDALVAAVSRVERVSMAIARAADLCDPRGAP
jgi:hypothetical protein